jgi:hypothetical protein
MRSTGAHQRLIVLPMQDRRYEFPRHWKRGDPDGSVPVLATPGLITCEANVHDRQSRGAAMTKNATRGCLLSVWQVGPLTWFGLSGN